MSIVKMYILEHDSTIPETQVSGRFVSVLWNEKEAALYFEVHRNSGCVIRVILSLIVFKLVKCKCQGLTDRTSGIRRCSESINSAVEVNQQW